MAGVGKDNPPHKELLMTETTQMASVSTGALGNQSRKEDALKALAIGCGDVLTS